MSINHFSSDHQDTQWWSGTSNPTQDPSQQHRHTTPHFIPQFYQDTHSHNYQAWLNSQQQQQQQPTAANASLDFNLNHNDPEFDHGADQLHVRHHLQKSRQDGDDDGDEEKEPMFEKPLTPSDVGKLNRLVIPKQHAEKYFPLGGGDSGLLLSFEDESGKSWRFRYSYWNSSQSYVLTKGWSRYVKEKRLDAGDVVLFERQRAHTDRLFIGWRRRSAAATPAAYDRAVGAAAHVSGNGESSSSNNNGAAGGWTRMFYSAPHHHNNNSSSYPAHQYAPYPPDYLHAAGSGAVQNSMNQTTSFSAGSSSKILRLFGVNLECQQQQQQQQQTQPEEADPHHHESEPSTPDGSSSLPMSPSQGPTQTHHQQLFTRAYNYGEQRDFTFTRDVNPMRDRRG